MSKNIEPIIDLKAWLNNNLKNTIWWFFIFLIGLTFKSNASTFFNDPKIDPIVSFDNVAVEFNVNGYYKFVSDIIITDTRKIYINIDDLFENLGIYCSVEEYGNSLNGFIENEQNKYSVDYNTKEIKINNKTIKSNNGIVKKFGALYLESTILKDVFGINIIFNYRSLSIKLEANFELPLVKTKKLEEIRNNIAKIQNTELKVDTVVQREYHLFKGAMLDWSINSSQKTNQTTSNRIGLGLGTELLYGQATISTSFNSQSKFNNKQLFYKWLWVDNSKKYIKQVEVGKIGNKSIYVLDSPLIGVKINNTPNTIRKASGYNTISDYTEPNWTVELYINDILVDYTLADATGLYIFKIPIVFGYSTLKYKFYGPLGEVRVKERAMNTPFTFMSPKKLEYNFSGGILQNSDKSKFGRGIVSYGVNRFVTIGGGLEYLSSIPNKPFIPFSTLDFIVFSKLMLKIEYAHNVRTKGKLNYNFGESCKLEIDYTKYVDGQLAYRISSIEERKIRLLLPFKIKKISGYSKLNFNQYKYNKFNFNQFNAVFSGYYKNLNTSLTTSINWVSNNSPYIASNIKLAYRFKSGYVIRPLAEFNISNNQFLKYKVEIEKRFDKMNFSISYERNLVYNTNNYLLNLSYDLPYARTNVSSSYSNDRLSLSENAQGSIRLNKESCLVNPVSNSALGKGGIIFYPFIDLNQNDKKDEGEQMILLNDVKIIGGNPILSKKDSTVRVSDLNSFVSYNIIFFDIDLDNIAWKFKHKTYQVIVNPNQYKRVDVPILSLGEVSGMVYLKKENSNKGQARVSIEIIDKKGNKVAETQSEFDGYYYYLGLNPGEYTVRVNEEQLKNLGYLATPSIHNAIIEVLIDGAIIEGLDFTIQSKKKIIKEEKQKIK